jgi:hypothetical protein
MEVSIEWLAGFFDGEGTFWVGEQTDKKNGKKYPKCIVMLSQSGDKGKEVLETIQETFGGNLYQHLEVGQHKATKPAYKLYWNKNEAIKLIEKLRSFLLIKHEEANRAYQYLTRDQYGA